MSLDFSVKALLIGDSGVGKSALLERFCDDSFTERFSSTIGIDFRNKTIEWHRMRLKLTIWDSAGQERFHALTKSYFRCAMAIFIVYDVTNEISFQNVRAWKSRADELKQDDAWLLLVGAKNDGSKREVETQRGQQLADELGIPFFETSAKGNLNVTECFVSLASNVLSPFETVNLEFELDGKGLAQMQPKEAEPLFNALTSDSLTAKESESNWHRLFYSCLFRGQVQSRFLLLPREACQRFLAAAAHDSAKFPAICVQAFASSSSSLRAHAVLDKLELSPAIGGLLLGAATRTSNVKQRVQITKAILAKKPNLEHRFKPTGSTPLLLAARHGVCDVLNLLLEAKASVDCRTESGDDLVHQACLSRNTECVLKVIPYFKPLRRTLQALHTCGLAPLLYDKLVQDCRRDGGTQLLPDVHTINLRGTLVFDATWFDAMVKAFSPHIVVDDCKLTASSACRILYSHCAESHGLYLSGMTDTILSAPSSIESLLEVLESQRLPVLRIDKCGLRDVPSWVFGLRHLTDLDLSGNALKSLPPGIGQLTALKRLDLRRNELTTLPFWLGAKGMSLQELLVDDNPGPLEGELGQFAANDDTLAFLRGMAAGTEDVKRIQLITIGNFYQGKTSILEALKADIGLGLSSTYLRLKPEDRTLSVTFTEYHDAESGMVWVMCDLPGHPEFYSSNIRFLSADRTVFVLVVNVSGIDDDHGSGESQLEQSIRQWLTLISAARRNLVDLRTVIVGTHADLITISPEKQKVAREQLRSRMETAFPGCKLQGMFFLNATHANRVKEELWPVLRPLAADMVQGRQIPKFVVHARNQLFAWRRARCWTFTPMRAQDHINRPWLKRDEALRLLAILLPQVADSDRPAALKALQSMGDIVHIRSSDVFVMDPG